MFEGIKQNFCRFIGLYGHTGLIAEERTETLAKKFGDVLEGHLKTRGTVLSLTVRSGARSVRLTPARAVSSVAYFAFAT